MMHFSRLLILFTIFSTISCSKSGKDGSFEAEVYFLKGMPKYDASWSLNDYAFAVEILTSLQIQYPQSLPMKDSKKSGIYFNKLISDDNFSFLEDSISLRKKATTLLRFSTKYDELVGLYYNNLVEQQYYRRELIEIYILGIKLSQNMLDIGRQIEVSHDTSLDDFKVGLFDVRDSYVNLIASMIKLTTKSDIYLLSDLKRLSVFISTSIKKNANWFNPTQKKTITKVIQKTVIMTSSEQIKNELNKVTNLL